MNQNTVAIENKIVTIGQVFVEEWGCEQTNIDFFKVVGFTASGKSVKIVPIGQTVTEEINSMVKKVLPDVNNVTGPQKTVRLGVWHDHIEAGKAWDWDGKPCMETSYA